MVVSNLKGGLGNYLFQVAAGYSLAKKNSVGFLIDLNHIRKVHTDYSVYSTNILRNIKTSRNIPGLSTHRYESLTYAPIAFRQNIFLDGYYQSDKYFFDRKTILDLFRIDETSLNYINNKYKHLLEKDTCSIHVRRGDYLKISFFNKLEMDYYNRAIDIIGRDKTFLIFSNDIEWCKDNFKNINATFIENEIDYIDLYLMSMCKNNIIANSTFSWWAAYLNEHRDAKIVAPKIWFIKNHSNEDINIKEWIKI